MIKKVVFFNLLHNGDLHVSRSLVNIAAKKLKNIGVECEYQHINHYSILIDLNIKYSKPEKHLTYRTKTHLINNTLYINTWYNSNPQMFTMLGVSFDTLFLYFSNVLLKYFNIDLSIEDLWTLFPSIDYSKFNTKNVDNFLLQHKDKKKILICNGLTLSGQSTNFDFNPIIDYLSEKYSNYIFLISNNEAGLKLKNNVITTASIIKKNSCDLNENGYISTQCDIVIGRFSGAYTFAMTTENYQRDMKFIVFCKYCLPSWIKNLPMNFKADIIHSEEVATDKIINIINKQMELL